jgi:hypothetical protein
MLMITVEAESSRVTLRLDGRLAGPEARELVGGWRSTAFNPLHQCVLVDLAGVTVVDGPGREFLTEIHRHGATLMAGESTAEVVTEIRSQLRPRQPDVRSAFTQSSKS